MLIPTSQILLREDDLPFRPESLGYFLGELYAGRDLQPAVVRPADGGVYRLRNGRHRFLASVIAGRPDVPCEIEE